MNPAAFRKADGFTSLLRHPRFIIGGSALGALVALELAASMLLGRIT